MLPPVPDRALLELGRTEGGPDTLALLVRDQDTRRLLMLRAVLDAVEGADPAVCSAGVRRRVREDWGLLEEADRAGDTAGAGTSLSPVRDRLLSPLLGPWAQRCLRGLDAAPEARTDRYVREQAREQAREPAHEPAHERARDLARDLAHLSALAAVAAARAGIPFAVRLTARDGVLTLPSLGALHTTDPGDTEVEARFGHGRLTLRQPGAMDTTVHLESGFGAWSSAPTWSPAYALPGLLPGSAPVPLDDLDPYRTAPVGPHDHGLSGPATLDDTERKRWLQAWSGTAAALRAGGDYRVTEATALLRCLVPLAAPPGADGHGSGSCSGTRREAFGALLSSTPPTAATFAATLVHELQHTKLSALSHMLTLHHAGPQRRYFAPWRPDPRPYDGLLQGAYSHLALADFFQRCALVVEHRAHREFAWARHARYREQVGAVLPTLVGSPELTPRGRQFVDQMVAVYERMAEYPAPRGHDARARAYVRAARALWTQRNASAIPPLKEAE
ncbi:HEXXH motif-containing putative peptide modification protein [Streptomyces bluensis]|uniref:aKG-HExxH-type peptide beta-hydroxylase n=1 Tax=Streptomyces bluensis TaxID=33897 RepID=UPI0036CE5B09